jgi:hypothetical protein
MIKRLILFFLLSFPISLSAQETDTRGTIKIQRKGRLAKVQFDNVNYRLVGIDEYGNVLDSAVIEFQLSVTIKGIFYSEKTNSSALSYKMQQLLGNCDKTSKIFFDKIKAKDRNGTLVEMPKFQYNYGYSDENNE